MLKEAGRVHFFIPFCFCCSQIKLFAFTAFKEKKNCYCFMWAVWAGYDHRDPSPPLASPRPSWWKRCGRLPLWRPFRVCVCLVVYWSLVRHISPQWPLWCHTHWHTNTHIVSFDSSGFPLSLLLSLLPHFQSLSAFVCHDCPPHVSADTVCCFQEDLHLLCGLSLYSVQVHVICPLSINQTFWERRFA